MEAKEKGGERNNRIFGTFGFFSFLLARRKKASGLRTRFPLRVSVSLRPSLCSIGAVHSVRLSLLRKPGHGGTGLSVKEFDGYSVGCPRNGAACW